MSAKKKAGPKDEAEKRPAGRPELPPEEKTHPRTIRFTDARWEKYQLLGRKWLEEMIDSATAETTREDE